MARKRVANAGYIPLDFEVLTLANSTAVGLNSTNLVANRLIFSVETNTARMRHDGTVPALTTGVLLQKDLQYELDGLSPSTLANLKFQRTTGTSTISVQAYKAE